MLYRILTTTIILLISIIVTIYGSAAAQSVPVLVIAMEFPNTDPTSDSGQAGRTIFPNNIIQIETDAWGSRRVFSQVVEDFFFGSTNSVRDYFIENSNGALQLTNAGVFGPYQAEHPAEYYWEELQKKNIDGHTVRKRELVETFIAEEITKRKSFNLAQFDRPPFDGVVTDDELVVILVMRQGDTVGNHRNASPKSGDSFFADGKHWKLKKPEYALVEVFTKDFSEPWDLGAVAHELSHLIFDAEDLYEDAETVPNSNPPGWDPTRPGPYSLMDSHWGHPHLDPLHKTLKTGWVQPIEIHFDGYKDVRSASNSNGQNIFKLVDPIRPEEYFLVENRQVSNYDSFLKDEGIAIWHVDEKLMPDWRKALEIEAATTHTNPINWDQYLWGSLDGEGLGLRWNNDSKFSDSRWHDGTKSNIGIWAIPDPNPTMRVYFDVPGPGLLVKLLPNEVKAYPGLTANFNALLVNTGPSKDSFEIELKGLPDWGYNLETTKASYWSGDRFFVRLDSYEETVLSVHTELPICVPPDTLKIELVGHSTSAKTLDKLDFTILPPALHALPDGNEPNQKLKQATEVTLGPTSTFTTKEILNQTLHSADVDVYLITYDNSNGVECTSKSEPPLQSPPGGVASLKSPTNGPINYPSQLAPSQLHSMIGRPYLQEGNLTLKAVDSYCRPLLLEVFDSKHQLVQSNVGSEVTIECPTQTFPDRSLYMKVQTVTGEEHQYDLSVSYSYKVYNLFDPAEIPEIKPYFEWPPQKEIIKPLPPSWDFKEFELNLINRLQAVEHWRTQMNEAELLHNIGRVAIDAELWDQAENQLSKSLDSFQKLDAPISQGNVIRSLGILRSRQGMSDKAVYLFNKALRLHQANKDAMAISADRIALGAHLLNVGYERDAMTQFLLAEQEQRRTGDHATIAVAFMWQAKVLDAVGEQEAAAAAVLLAERYIKRVSNSRVRNGLEAAMISTSRILENNIQMLRNNYEEVEKRYRIGKETVLGNLGTNVSKD